MESTPEQVLQPHESHRGKITSSYIHSNQSKDYTIKTIHTNANVQVMKSAPYFSCHISGLRRGIYCWCQHMAVNNSPLSFLHKLVTQFCWVYKMSLYTLIYWWTVLDINLNYWWCFRFGGRSFITSLTHFKRKPRSGSVLVTCLVGAHHTEKVWFWLWWILHYLHIQMNVYRDVHVHMQVSVTEPPPQSDDVTHVHSLKFSPKNTNH